MSTSASFRVISKNKGKEKIHLNFHTSSDGDPGTVPLEIISPLQDIDVKKGGQGVVSMLLSEGYIDTDSVITQFEYGDLGEDFLYEICVIDKKSIEITVIENSVIFTGNVSEYIKFVDTYNDDEEEKNEF